MQQKAFDNDVRAMLKRLRSLIDNNDKQALKLTWEELATKLEALENSPHDEPQARDCTSRVAIEAGALEALELCFFAQPRSLANCVAACYAVVRLALSDHFVNRIAKSKPGIIRAIVELLDVKVPGVANAAVPAICRLINNNICGRLAADAGLLPKLIPQLDSGNAHVACIAIYNLVQLSGNRAIAAVKAGVLQALPRLVCGPRSSDVPERTKAVAAGALGSVLAFLPPSEKLPQGAELQQCAAALVLSLRAGGAAADKVAALIRVACIRAMEHQSTTLLQALAQAGAAAPLLQLAKHNSSSISTSTSSTSDIMSTQRNLVYLLGLLLQHGQQPALHDLVVRAGGIELAVQLALQPVQQRLARRQAEGAMQAQLPLEEKQANGESTHACMCLLHPLLRKQPELAARAAAAGAVHPLLGHSHVQSEADTDEVAVLLVTGALQWGSEPARYANDALEAGVAKLMIRHLTHPHRLANMEAGLCLLAKLVEVLLEDAAVELAPLLRAEGLRVEDCDVELDDGTAMVLQPVMQHLVALAGRPGLPAEVREHVSKVLEQLGETSRLLCPPADVVEGLKAGRSAAGAQQGQQQREGGDSSAGAAAGSSTAAASDGEVVRDQEQQQPECGACGAGSKPDGKALMQCSACQGVWYCSATCQRKHWKVHKKECLRT